MNMKTQSTLDKLKELEAQFAAQKASLLGEAEKELLEKIKSAKAALADLEAQYAELKGNVVLVKSSRPRMTAEGFQSLKNKVADILAANPKGVKMGFLSQSIGANPNVLRKALKELKAKSEGEKRAMVYKA